MTKGRLENFEIVILSMFHIIHVWSLIVKIIIFLIYRRIHILHIFHSFYRVITIYGVLYFNKPVGLLPMCVQYLICDLMINRILDLNRSLVGRSQ